MNDIVVCKSLQCKDAAICFQNLYTIPEKSYIIHTLGTRLSKKRKTTRKCVNDIIYFQNCITIIRINRITFV
jgi:hypothetical protein